MFLCGLFFNQMKKFTAILFLAANILTGVSFSAAAQTNVYTITNVVTLLVTNIVTVTNVVANTPSSNSMTGLALAAVVKNPWQSSIAAGLTLTRGNSDTLLVTAGVLTEKKDKVNEWTFGGEAAYGENKVDTGSGTNKASQYVKNTDTAHLFGQYNHLFSEKFYGYLRVNALHDGISDLQYRVTIGPGVGYYLLKQTNTTLAIESGTAFVYERLGNENNSYATLRLAERFEHKFFEQRARVWQSIEILPQVDNFNNYLVNAEIGIESALSKKLSLQTFLADNFINRPATGRQQNDVKLVSGLKYKF